MALRKSIVNRFTLVYIVIVLAFVLAIARMLSIITVEQEAWMVEAAKLQCANREIKPERGNLFADDGSLITATIPYYNIYMDMKVENYSTEKGRKMFEENIDSLSICLSQKFGDKTPAQYKAMIKKGMLDGKRSLRLYSRRVSYIDLMEIKQFPIIREGTFKSGFYYEELANRENMYGSLANRTLGDVNLEEGTGKYGLEMYYDSLLSGVPGSERGHLVGGGRWAFIEEKAPVHGANIYTTIDIEMQDICETAMREKLAEIDAVSACVVLMEVKTGAIRAMVNLERASDGTYFEGRNMAVSDLSEPGSTFKTMSLMVALDNGVCDTADVLDLNHGLWKFGPRTMKDHNYDRGGYGELTVAEVLAQSSNVGVSRVIDEYYKDKPMDFVNAILDTKFAEQLDFGIPGIARPIIPTKSDKRWSRTTLPWMSIGYEVQVPPVYTLNFYNALANGGKMMRPYLVKEVRRGEQVLMKNEPKVMKESICRKETLGKVQGMLEGVIKYGTGKPMRMKQFDIAGKTGTAQLEYANGKAKGHQITFCGYFPADAPLYSCIVVIKNQQKNHLQQECVVRSLQK